MRSCSENYQKDAYVLKLDISGFFMSIEKEKLWEKVKDLVDCSERPVTRKESSVSMDDDVAIHVPLCHPVGAPCESWKWWIPISSPYEKKTLSSSKDDFERDSSASVEMTKRNYESHQTSKISSSILFTPLSSPM